MSMRKAKYPVAPISTFVDAASSVKVIMLIIREAMMRFGYDAPTCRRVKMSMAPRFVTVETEISAAWKCSRIQGESAKRDWKYGPAARNMFHAQSIEMPSKRKMLYSMYEKAGLSAELVSRAAPSRVSSPIGS